MEKATHNKTSRLQSTLDYNIYTHIYMCIYVRTMLGFFDARQKETESKCI